MDDSTKQFIDQITSGVDGLLKINMQQLDKAIKSMDPETLKAITEQMKLPDVIKQAEAAASAITGLKNAFK